jgi:hypothetical protein
MGDDGKRNWFSTLPGILTSAGGFVAALTGLLVALNQVGVLPVRTKPVATVATSAPKPAEGKAYVVWHAALSGGSWRLASAEYPGNDPCTSTDRTSGGTAADSAMLKTVRDYYAAWNDRRLDDAWALLTPSYQSANETTWRATHSTDSALRLSSDCVLSDSRVGLTVVSTPR